MDARMQSLWQRVDEFQLDGNDATLTFTARLARDNGWSRSHARRVCDEYKRFMLLTVLADHIVTPPEAVDQAWHLHLTYTRSYWIDFCDGVLGRKVHHDPTRGIEEQSRFVELYEQTLETYERVFGQAPPRDIWPPAAVRFGEDLNNRWVNLSRHWVVPKPRLPKLGSRLAWPRILLGGLAVPPLVALANPFDFSGTEFLLFYGILFLAGLVVALVLRTALAEQPPSLSAEDLSPTEAAFLAGGMQRALHATISGLLQSRTLALEQTEKRVFGFLPGRTEYRVVATGAPGDRNDPLHRAVYAAAFVPGGATAGDLRKTAAAVVPELRDSLASRGLVGPSPWADASHYVPMLIMLAIALVGVVKIFVGVSRDKPIGFLVAATLVTAAVALFFMVRSRVTKQGKQLVEELQNRHASLAEAAKNSGDTLSPTELSLAVALFGATILAIGPLATIGRAVETFHYTTAGASGGGCGAGGCGGGGCGGGCGGCGGCGG